MKILIDSFNRSIQSEAGGVQMKIMSYYNSLLNNGYDVKLFDKWIDKIADYDILHLFKLSQEYLDEIIWAKDHGVKVVLSSIIAISGGRTIKAGLKLSNLLPISTVYQVNKKILNLCDAIISETSLEKNFISEVYGIDKKKIYSIANGVAIDLSSASDALLKEKLNITQDIVLCIGRFDRNKNQINVIKALSMTDLPVVFIGGPGPGEESYYEECQRISTPNMHFLGWVDHDSDILKSAFKAAKVVVLASYHETFGYVIFEGSLAGANIAVTNVLPIEEWGLDRWMTKINPKDVEDIRRGILNAYSMNRQPDLQEYVNKEFSFKRICDYHIDVYKTLLEK